MNKLNKNPKSTFNQKMHALLRPDSVRPDISINETKGTRQEGTTETSAIFGGCVAMKHSVENPSDIEQEVNIGDASIHNKVPVLDDPRDTNIDPRHTRTSNEV